MDKAGLDKVADAYGEIEGVSTYVDNIVKQAPGVVDALKTMLKKTTDPDGVKKALTAAEDLKKCATGAQKGVKSLRASLGLKHLESIPTPKDYQAFVVAQKLLKPLTALRDSISRFKLAMDLGGGMFYCMDSAKVASTMIYTGHFDTKLLALQTDARKLTS